MFDNRFETLVADTEVSKAIHYNLRYQVYCLERRFENPAAFPDQLETDDYDKNSVHFIVRHRESGQWIGAMRLVLAISGKLPLTLISTVDTNSIGSLANTIVAEVSRLCVLPLRNQETTERPDIVHPSVITLGLIRAARQYLLSHNIQFSYFLITAQLARILERVGMEIKPVGPPVDHRGPRRPYVHDVKNGYRTMRDKSPLVYEMFQVSPAYKHYSKTQVRKTARQFVSDEASDSSEMKSQKPMITCGVNYALPSDVVAQVRRQQRKENIVGNNKPSLSFIVGDCCRCEIGYDARRMDR